MRCQALAGDEHVHLLARGVVAARRPQRWRQEWVRWAAQAQPWALPSVSTGFSSSLTSPETLLSEVFVPVL